MSNVISLYNIITQGIKQEEGRKIWGGACNTKRWKLYCDIQDNYNKELIGSQAYMIYHSAVEENK